MLERVLRAGLGGILHPHLLIGAQAEIDHGHENAGEHESDEAELDRGGARAIAPETAREGEG